MSYDVTSLDFIYYPISGILWVWHKVFGSVLGEDNGYAWALSVVFLVFTLRVILYKPFVRQVRTTAQMKEFQPQMAAIRKKYSNDRQKQALELQKLQREHGFNPVLGCLPMLLQIPVFIGLYHVLHSFNRTAGGFGRVNLSVEETRTIPNYFFPAEDVQSFLDARFFGAPLSSYITGAERAWTAFMPLGEPINFTRGNIIWVAIPLMLISSIATHMNSRASIARQSPESLDNPQTAIMNKLALYVFPLGVLVGGLFLPIAILIYFVANNIWTYFQQHVVFGKMSREEEAKKQEQVAKAAANAPKPGQRPKRKAGGAAAASTAATVVTEGSEADGDAEDDPDSAVDLSKPKPGAKPGGAKAATSKPKPKGSGQQSAGKGGNRSKRSGGSTASQRAQAQRNKRPR